MGTRAVRRGRPLPGLKQAREDAFLSQMELSRRSGVGQPTIWELEAGDRGRGAYPQTIRKLAKGLGVEPGVLVKTPDAEKRELVTS